MVVPETSTTLLRDLAHDSKNARWGEFVERYRPMMEAFLRERFPSVESDDIIQETLIAIWRILPAWRYSPDEKGSFHNYLTGILRKKAIRAAIKKEKYRERALARASHEQEGVNARDCDEQSWQRSVFEIALKQLLADDSVNNRTREVFRRVAVNGEKPEDVALSFGISRNAVDQMKSRMMARLKKLVGALNEVNGGGYEK